MKRLYVGNIPWSATEAALTERFGVHGTLVSVRVITDRDTGRSKGFAFVEYEEESAAQAALDAENETDMDGRTLRVSEAISKDQTRRDGPRGHAPRGNGNRNRHEGGRDDNRKRSRGGREGGRRDSTR